MSNKTDKTEKGGVELSRRRFIKVSGTAAGLATVGVGGVSLTESGMVHAADPADPGYIDLSKAKTFSSSCAMECLHHNLTAYVVDGKLVNIDTSACEPTKGCARGLSRVQWVNHPDRLKKPMLRTGEKGEGKFKEISWDEAFNLIIEKINTTKKELGNKGLAYRGGSGSFASLTNPIANAFFSKLGGSTPIVGSLCCQAVSGTMVPMFGTRFEDTRDTIEDSQYILVWGTNPAVTMGSYLSWYQKALDRGARMIVIDPRFSETAAKSHEWVPILPGTDTALALGMLKIIIEEKRYDLDFMLQHSSLPFLVSKATGDQVKLEGDETGYLVFDTQSKTLVRHDAPGAVPALSTVGLDIELEYHTVFDMVYSEAKPWTIEKVEQETDVPAGTVLRLAREYSSRRPAMIIQNMGGFQRTEYGSYAVAAHIYLAVFTGNIGKAGTGICDAGGIANSIKVNDPVPVSPTPKLDIIPAPRFADYILHDNPTKIGFLWSLTNNFITQFPNTNGVKEAFKKIPFVVVVENLMTSTALYADLVLPCTTVFEETNLLANHRNRFVQLMEKAVEPPGEAMSDLAIFTELAKRMGFGEEFDKTPEELIEVCLAGTGVTLEQLKEGPVRTVPTPFIPYPDGVFKTKTKKAELFMPSWKAKNMSPVVAYIRPNESVKGSPEMAKKYPLMAVQRKLHRGIHSSFSALPWMCETYGVNARVLMHPEDARERGIEDGERVIAYNDRGEHRCVAIVKPHIKKGIVALENGWWEQLGGSSSHVTSDFLERLSGGHACNNTLVDVKKEA